MQALRSEVFGLISAPHSRLQLYRWYCIQPIWPLHMPTVMWRDQLSAVAQELHKANIAHKYCQSAHGLPAYARALVAWTLASVCAHRYKQMANGRFNDLFVVTVCTWAYTEWASFAPLPAIGLITFDDLCRMICLDLKPVSAYTGLYPRGNLHLWIYTRPTSRQRG